MAQITCAGNCLTCEHRLSGEADPRECASIFGFMAVQKLQKSIDTLQAEIEALKQADKSIAEYSETSTEV